MYLRNQSINQSMEGLSDAVQVQFTQFAEMQWKKSSTPPPLPSPPPYLMKKKIFYYSSNISAYLGDFV